MEYFSSGNLSVPPGIKKAGDDLERAGKMFSGLSSAAGSFNTMLDGLASTLGGAVMSAASAMGTVVAGGFALAIREVFHFNEELENTQVGLAQVANASGTVANLGGGFRLAGDVIKQMRTDARELPGSFQDLQKIMNAIEPATSGMGMGMFGTEKMARELMVTAHATNLRKDTAARELGMMLGSDKGAASTRMPLWRALNLGMDTHTFNQLSVDKRRGLVQGKLDKFNSPESLDMMKHMWSTIKSNLTDSLRIGAGQIGGPLFQRVKDAGFALANFGHHNDGESKAQHDAVEKIRTRYMDAAVKLGDGLVKAFDRGEAAIKHWYGPITTFMGTVERGFERIFNSFGPELSGALGHIEKFLNDPAAFSKIEHLVAGMVALRAGGAVVEGGASLGAAALPGALALGGGGTEGAAAVAAAAWPVAAALSIVAIASYGAIHAITDVQSQMHGLATKQLATLTHAAYVVGEEFNKMWAAISPLVDLIGVTFLGYLQMTVDCFIILLKVVNSVIWVFQKIADIFHIGLKPTEGVNLPRDYKPESLHVMNAPAEPGDIGAKKPPNTNVHIGKIEIKVDGEADPQRVASLVVTKLMDAARNPTKSTGGPPTFDGQAGY